MAEGSDKIIVMCTRCGVKARIPANRVMLEIKCLKCNNTFRVNSGEKKMSFADELRKPDPPKKSRAQVDYEKTLNEIHGAIRVFCVKNKQERRAEGYIIRGDDSEYGMHYLVAVASLTKPYIREIDERDGYSIHKSKDHSLSAMYELPDIDSTGHSLYSNAENCNIFLNELKQMLVRDGFDNINLLTVPVYYVKDICHCRTGLLHCKYWLERERTNQILGYTIKFSVSW